MARDSHEIRNGLICVLIVAACLWAAHPVAEMGFIDDWSYARSAQVFAQTGHLVYNGWATAMLGWQIVWAALFIKLFGFSFTVVRLSMLPITLATIFLFHSILVRFGVHPRNAVIGTLTLGLSPLFLPLAASYMTDVPGLFVIVLCLYLCQRAVQASTNRIAIAWLCLAAATNVIGGTARQIAWLGALVMVPSAGWLLRKRRGVLLTAALLWVISSASVFACMHWFALQPYSVPEPLFKGPGASEIPILHTSIQLLDAVLCLLLLAYPILVAYLATIGRINRTILWLIACFTLIWGLIQSISGWLMPWINSIIDYQFLADKTLGQDNSPMFLHLRAREAISLLVITTALIAAHDLTSRLSVIVKKKSFQAGPWRDTLWLLGPFALSYGALLLPRAYHTFLYDRYLLPLMPIMIIFLLMQHQQWMDATLPVASVIVLAIFSFVAVGTTHDWFAYYRARLAAINEIRASGVPRTEIQGGFEYDGWTQIETGGYINDPHLVVPLGAYHPVAPSQIPDQCRFPLDFYRYTPSVHPKFTVVLGEMWCLAPSNYPPVHYRAWLPPYDRAIYVQTTPAGSH